jgi:DNA-directed RNA polymerase subunit RPC12/RpoP
MEYICKYCGREYKNKNALTQHKIRCKENPDRLLIKGNRSHHTSWNKGLTKETDERVKRNGESISNGYKTGKITNWCQGLTKDNDIRIRTLSEKSSKTILSRVKDDTWHNSFGKSKLVEYKCIQFHGNWEVEFAKFLDTHNIEWERNTQKFEYLFENKTHYYTPDFYLPRFDLFVEIKGYPTQRDFCKWNDFPNDKRLNIYFGDELYDLGIIVEYKDVYKSVPLKYRKKFNIL